MARKAGFDPRDFSTNGIFLPCTEKAALLTKRPLHRGPHPGYNKLVAERLASIFRRESTNFQDIQSRNVFLCNLQRALFRNLSANSRGFILNKRDPLARKVDFKCLDDDLNGLWGVTGRHITGNPASSQAAL